MTICDDHGNLDESTSVVDGVEIIMLRRTGSRAIREIAISQFKAKCLALLEEVHKTKAPLRVTRRGKPLADVVPASPEVRERVWIGSMTGTAKITGDIVSPIIDIREIEALRK